MQCQNMPETYHKPMNAHCQAIVSQNCTKPQNVSYLFSLSIVISVLQKDKTRCLRKMTGLWQWFRLSVLGSFQKYLRFCTHSFFFPLRTPPHQILVSLFNSFRPIRQFSQVAFQTRKWLLFSSNGLRNWNFLANSIVTDTPIFFRMYV